MCKQISWVTIKGAIIIHAKFRGARILKILRCFRILHVQILSGFKNWDIQDLTLRRCDTLKSCRWNFFKLSWVVHYSWEKQEATTLKRSKILQKLNKGDCFCLNSWFHFFYGTSRTKIHWHNKYIFKFSWFFEQDHLLNVFILGVHAERWLKCARISKQKLRIISYERF